MGLNKVKGNMYDFVTHTWNPIKGDCHHSCAYCYMKAIAKRFNKPMPPAYFDEKELNTNLGKGNFIFVGSSNDLFAEGIPAEWINKTLDHCRKFDNRYLFQTKNPARYDEFMQKILRRDIVVTTIETNRKYIVMGNTPHPRYRSMAMQSPFFYENTMITIEPVIDFDLQEFVEMVRGCKPKQVNVGADSGHNNLPEPPKEKILQLIAELEKFTTVKQKSNLSRLLK